MTNFNLAVAAIRTFIRNKKGHKFEPEIRFLKNVLNRGDICFHIGASDARHSYVMSELIDNGHIYAFEPSAYSYKHLVLMTKLHRLNNINTYNLAVSDKVGMVCLVTPKKSTGHIGRSFAYITDNKNANLKRTDIKANEVLKQEVATVSVDDFVVTNKIEKVDFIRCDTEGSEMLILAGAVKTIEQYKPGLLLEIHTKALKEIFNSSAEAVLAFLFERGYQMFREDAGEIKKADKVDESEPWKDYFFIHSDRVGALPAGPFRELLNP